MKTNIFLKEKKKGFEGVFSDLGGEGGGWWSRGEVMGGYMVRLRGI